MTKNQEKNKEVPLLKTFLSYKKKYGVFSVIVSILLVFMFVILMRICYEPSFLLDNIQKYQQIKHEAAQQRRIVHDDEINNILPQVLKSCNASRTWIVQFHNGTSDWSFGSMRFELCADDVSTIQYQYSDFHLSWLKLPSYLRQKGYFIGDRDALAKVDHVIYDRFEMNDIQYMACVLIKRHNKEVGILGLTWVDTPTLSDQDIAVLLSKYAGKLEEFL